MRKGILLFFLCVLWASSAGAVEVEGRAGLQDSDDWLDPAVTLALVVQAKQQMVLFDVSAPWESTSQTCRHGRCKPAGVDTPTAWRVNYRYWAGAKLGVWGQFESDDLRGEVYGAGISWRIK